MSNRAEEAKRTWEEKLFIQPAMSLSESLEMELAEYEKIDNEELRRRLSICKEELNKQWEGVGHKDPRSFYKSTRWYLYDLTLYHSNHGPYREIVDVLDFCLSRNLESVLDFGGGIGSAGILFAASGLKATVSDISSTLLDYARWRFKKRGLRADFIELDSQELPTASYDVVVSTDVMEHLADPKKELDRIGKALKNGGYLFFNITETEGSTHPMHISGALKVLPYVRSCGFKKVKDLPVDSHKYRKVDRPAAFNMAIGVFDRFYYPLYFFAISLLSKLGLLTYIKKAFGRSK